MFYTVNLRIVVALAVLGCAAADIAAAETGQPGLTAQARIDVLVIEWSGSDTSEIGTSIIFRREPLDNPSSTGSGIVESVQSNFPKFSSPSTLGFSLFADRIRFHYGEMETVVEAVESNEHVNILSRQTVFVAEGNEGRIATVNRVPYETTKAFGSTTAQITAFRDTGVTFKTKLQKVIDDEYLVLLIAADVKEIGRRVTVALADQTSQSTWPMSSDTSSLKVPEFDSRRISTTVAVRDGDTLVLGGLVTKTKVTDEQTVPVLGPALKKVGKVPVVGMLSAARYAFTSRREREEYRELIFFVTPHIARGYSVFLPEDMIEEPKEEAAQEPPQVPALNDTAGETVGEME